MIKAKAEIGMREFERAENTLTRICQLNGVTFDLRKLFIELFKKWEAFPLKGARMAFQIIKELGPDCSTELKRKSFKDLIHFLILLKPMEIHQVITKEVLVRVLKDTIDILFLEDVGDLQAEELFTRLMDVIISKSVLDQNVIDDLWLQTLPTIQIANIRDSLFDMYVLAKESMSDRKTVAEVLLKGKELQNSPK